MGIPIVMGFICMLALCSSSGVRGEREERLVLYMHDTTLYKNASFNTDALDVKNTPITNLNQFGNLYIFDDPITTGPSMASPLVGSAQGLYVYSGRTSLSAFWAFTTFLGARGSVSFMGAEQLLQPTELRALPIVGGTGDFALSRGLVTLSTAAYTVPKYFVLTLNISLHLP